MPTRWESSERPLFVKTVVVNGSRHAILSQVDPLCQARRTDASSHSGVMFADLDRDDISMRRARSCYPAKRDVSSDLQNCLVKLRVVLGTQENKKKMKKEMSHANDEDKCTQNDNWKHVRRNLGNIKQDECSSSGASSNLSMPSIMKEEDTTGFEKGNSYGDGFRKNEREVYVEDVTKIPDGCMGSNSSSELEIEDPAGRKLERTNLMRKILPLSDTTEEIFKNYSTYFFPIVYIKANGISWDEGDAIDRNGGGNPLSERVMQWLDLARRRKESGEKERPDETQKKGETIIQTNSEAIRKLVENINKRKHKLYYCKCDSVRNKNLRTKESTYYIKRCEANEDVEEEVKQELDVVTALSSADAHDQSKIEDHQKKTAEAVRDEKPGKKDRPTSLLSIPEKKTELSITEQLQQSILNSFEAIVTLERTPRSQRHSKQPRKKSFSEVTRPKLTRRKGLLMKQASIKISSDEDEHPNRVTKTKRKAPDRYRSYKEKSEHRREKNNWEHRRRFKYLFRSKGSDDENHAPSDESGSEIRILYNERSLNKNDRSGDNAGRKVWTHDGGVKPQLHIFMPELDPKFLESQEESASETDNL